MGLEISHRGLLWMGLGLANLLGWLVVGLSKAGTWPLLAFKYVAEKAREVWRKFFDSL
jgi:hypothetical protein